jgi:galactonate dehydratase
MALPQDLLEGKRRRLLAAAQPRGAKPAVAITDLMAHAVREPAGQRTYVLVTVKTDAGVTGVGETIASPDPHTAVQRVLAYKPHLLGQDATAAEAVRQVLRGAAGTLGAGAAETQAAVNMALWDVLGKLSKAPVYELCGGPTRTKARALAHLHGSSEGQLKDSLQRARQAGYRAYLVRLPAADEPPRGRTFYARSVRLLESLRQAAGDDADFVLDCGGRLTPAAAAGLARALERFHLLWLDEPTGPVQYQAFSKIAAEAATPLGVGRDVVANADFQELLRLEAVDVLRPDVARNGITAIRKAAALAETYYVAVAPGNRGGPVATAAALQVAASIPNFFIQEVPYPADDRDVRMRRELAGDAVEVATDGFLALPKAPGLGVSLNEEALEKYRV